MADSVVEISASDAPKTSDPHRIVISFPDDHEINGMKVDVSDVTPEQVAVAVFHLQRVASQLADVRQFSAEQARRQVAQVSRELRRKQ